jgi:hypothetical protein
LKVNKLYFLSVDAVYAMAHSLHNLVLEQCCPNFHRALDRETVLEVSRAHDRDTVLEVSRALDTGTVLEVSRALDMSSFI